MTTKEKWKLTNLPAMNWVGIFLYLTIMVGFLFCYPFFVEGTQSAFQWVSNPWSRPRTGLTHGWLIPIIGAVMFVYSLRSIRNHTPEPSLAGLLSVVFGAILCVASVRTQQARLAWLAFPFLYGGMCWCYLGFYATRKTIFPFFYFWLAVPAAFLEQYTTGMQHLSAQLAHWGAELCGVKTILEGTNVISADGSWDTFSIAGGCSGMRSLSVLLMLSLCWAYMANKLSLWKRIILGLSAFPISILANSFRVTSIFIFAEYISSDFAGKTWHDWSGLLLFFPASLVCMTILHGLLAGEIFFLKKRRIITRRHSSDTP